MRSLIRVTGVVSGLLTISLLLLGCGAPIPSASAPTGSTGFSIKETGTGPSQHDVEVIRLNNCDGKAPTTQVAERGQSVQVGGGASLGGGTVIQAAVSGNYSTGANTATSQQLTAPPGTNMEFTIEWTIEERDGIVTKEGMNVDPAQYRLFRPVNVQIASQRDLGCSQTSQPPTSIALAQTPTSAPAPTIAPSNTPLPSPTTRPTNTPPTPTSTPVEDVLYEADWSKGFNGWVGSPDWKTVSGMLVNDGMGDFPTSGIIRPPYQPNSIADYAVEAEMQVIAGRGGGCAAHYGFIIRGQEKPGPLAGYLVGGINTLCSGQGYTTIGSWISPKEPYNVQSLKSGPRVGDMQWHKYRVEAQGNKIRLVLDTVPIVEAVDNLYLEGGLVALWSGKAVMNVRSFRIIKL